MGSVQKRNGVPRTEQLTVRSHGQHHVVVLELARQRRRYLALYRRGSAISEGEGTSICVGATNGNRAAIEPATQSQAHATVACAIHQVVDHPRPDIGELVDCLIISHAIV